MKYSIIIPVYNHAQELGLCIDSILAQTLWNTVPTQEAEVIIVNDGSIDDIAYRILAISKNIQEKGFSFQYIHQENAGAAVARNNGYDHSIGESLLFCDADVQLASTCLEKMSVGFVNHPEIGFVYSRFRFGWKMFSSFPFDPGKLKQLNYIHTTSLIRRVAFVRFDESLKKFQDWDLFLTMVERGWAGAFIPEVLFMIKERSTGMSQWVPSFAYHWPWKLWPRWKKTVEKYETAKAILSKKHSIV